MSCIHTDKQTARQAVRETDRQNDRQTQMHTEVHTNIRTCVRAYLHPYVHASMHIRIYKHRDTHTHCLLAICIHGQHILKAFIHVLVSCVYLADARIYVLADGLDGWVGRRGRRRPYMEACTLM